MEAAETLQKIINQVTLDFSSFSEEDWSKKPAPNKWSKKEILGHLIDSEYNNHVRVIKSAASPEPISLDIYIQDDWVKRNNYQAQGSDKVLNSWKMHQEAFFNLIKGLTEEELQHQLIYKENNISLEWVITDYVEHQIHHLRKIFGPSFLAEIKITPRG